MNRICAPHNGRTLRGERLAVLTPVPATRPRCCRRGRSATAPATIVPAARSRFDALVTHTVLERLARAGRLRQVLRQIR